MAARETSSFPPDPPFAAPGRAHHVRIRTAPDRIDEALQEIVAPVLWEIAGEPPVEAAFFGRSPHEALLFVVGDPGWLTAAVPSLVERRAGAAREARLVESVACSEFRPEIERYGGEEGLRLAGRIFQEDSLACLALIAADRRGALEKSRREWSLVVTERFLDLVRFDAARRSEFYAYCYGWAVEGGQWGDDEMRLLEERYRGLRADLLEIVEASRAGDPDALYGGPEPARVARAWLGSTRPVVDELLEAHAGGRIRQNLLHLAWSYTHLHCNRLGISGESEAVLRFFMHRLYQEEPGRTA